MVYKHCDHSKFTSDFRRHDRVPKRWKKFCDQHPEVQEGMQCGTHRRRDQSVAVHHADEENLPHRLSW